MNGEKPNISFTIVHEPEKDRGGCCGLTTDFPETPIGGVVRCGYCGRLWKRRPNWIDGQASWSWEQRAERRRRLSRAR